MEAQENEVICHSHTSYFMLKGLKGKSASTWRGKVQLLTNDITEGLVPRLRMWTRSQCLSLYFVCILQGLSFISHSVPQSTALRPRPVRPCSRSYPLECLLQIVRSPPLVLGASWAQQCHSTRLGAGLVWSLFLPAGYSSLFTDEVQIISHSYILSNLQITSPTSSLSSSCYHTLSITK